MLGVEEMEAKMVLDTSAERIVLLLSMMNHNAMHRTNAEKGISLDAESASSQLSDLAQTPTSADEEDDDGDETMIM
jgi:hypothetical protein